MRLHPFDIPEVLDKIVACLDTGDIKSCIYVSKAFHEAFIRFLWKTINVDTPNWSAVDGQTLEKHKHYIEEIYFTYRYAEHILLLRGCSRLRKLVSRRDKSQRFEDLLYRLSNLMIANNFKLQECEINWAHEKGTWTYRAKDFYNAVLQCPHLRELKLHDFIIHAEEIDLFFRMCSQLEILELTRVDIPQWAVGKLIGNLGADVGTAAGAFAFGYLLELTLCETKVIGPHPISEAHSLVTFIQSCPNLRSLTFYDGATEDMVDFCRTLAPALESLPHLESLIIPEAELNDKKLAAFLGKMNRLRKLHAWQSDFGPLCLAELLKPRGPLNGGTRFCDMIEDLSAPTFDFTDRVIPVLLSSCRNLTLLETSVARITDIITGQEWVCSKLQRLELSLVLDVYNDEERKAKQRILFERLGKLTKLQELHITTGYSLTLDAGLDKLINLKRLRYLAFHHGAHFIGPDEAVWMVENWPCLEEVIGLKDKDPAAVGSIAGIFNRRGIIYH
ncbi:hypothetical protein BX616_000948 [Lobosporangium transversale]|uniref:F-box domain-containing protein n=1 Tax=Lobosporangium transversale TaxID=64571 RepID=A0A1Y2GVW6_9FUNG|nr:hypothetical protein BCR41DRAFT_348238 [Lobosporangium transversale]KAF9917449.1 hypothetical protein BX616_000948 [Lobosporangium transversale]ORZ26407.1 hypothetical protein BCR41DRAFT_348238 [Lobosporangium transversale]|eukprot:XP_021884172.1 hypothetical protein BCR41DRAFT_348238 [Lobosporangium transversale]